MICYELHFTKKMTWNSPMMDEKGMYDLTNTTPLLKYEDTLKLSHEILSHDVLTLRDVPDNTVTMTGKMNCLK